MELKELLKLGLAEIFDYVIKNPNEEKSILNNLKSKDRDKFFKLSSDLQSYRLNQKGSAALVKNVLETVTKDKSIVLLDVSLIKPNPNQPRRIFDEEKLKELSDSVIKHGLLQPIVVVVNKDNSYTLVAGERRLRAHKLANLPEIKAIVIDVDEAQSTNLAIIENLHRDNLSPMEEGLTYLSLQKINGYSYRDLEEIVFKDKNYIAARINLTKFDDDCIELILNHQLKNISKLAKILDAEGTVHYMLLEKLSKNELTNEEIEKYYIDRIRKVPTPKAKPGTNAKPTDVDHDKFNDNPDFSKDNQKTAIEAITEKIKENEKTTIEDTAILVKESNSFFIKSNDKIVNITIDTDKLTGKDLEAVIEYLKAL